MGVSASVIFGQQSRMLDYYCMTVSFDCLFGLRWMAKSDAHVGYVGRVRASDGRVLSGKDLKLRGSSCHFGSENSAVGPGTFIAPILRSKQRLNSFRMKGEAHFFSCSFVFFFRLFCVFRVGFLRKVSRRNVSVFFAAGLGIGIFISEAAPCNMTRKASRST